MSADLRARIAADLAESRARTTGLTAVLDDDELTAQHSPLMSPLVWDFAHVGNYEDLWLARAAGRLSAHRPELDGIYDAFAHPRADRARLPILSPAEALRYGAEVRDRALAVLATADLDPAVPLTGGGAVHAMVVSHEHQHAETMLATHQLRAGAAVLVADAAATLPAGRLVPSRDVLVPGGPFVMGVDADPAAWDNERPAHPVDVPAFRIDVLPVTNAAFAAFVAAGGYDEPRHWSPAGWAHRVEAGLVAPAGWRRGDSGGWRRRRFGVDEPLPADEPVQHVGFHEAAAYARWAGRRLPTEAEWEKACGWDPEAGRTRRWPWGEAAPTPELANLTYDGLGALRPAPVGAFPAGASAYGVEQLIGDVWEWCSSPFRSYPGFRAFPYEEYSQVFFGPDYRVLRGGSWATHPSTVRTSFRNWDYPIRRQIFAGFRTAVDAPAGGRLMSMPGGRLMSTPEAG